MTAIPVSPLQPNNDDEQLLPLTSELIGKITQGGSKPSGINSDQIRELKRLLNGYTGGILIEAVDGRVLKDGIHCIKITTYK